MLEVQQLQMNLVEVRILSYFPKRFTAFHQGFTIHDVRLEYHRIELLAAAAAFDLGSLLECILYPPEDLHALLRGLQLLHQLLHLFKHLRRLGQAILLRWRLLLLLLLLFQLLLYEVELLIESYELLLLLFDLALKFLVVSLQLLVFSLHFLKLLRVAAELIGVLLQLLDLTLCRLQLSSQPLVFLL